MLMIFATQKQAAVLRVTEYTTLHLLLDVVPVPGVASHACGVNAHSCMHIDAPPLPVTHRMTTSKSLMSWRATRRTCQSCQTVTSGPPKSASSSTSSHSSCMATRMAPTTAAHPCRGTATRTQVGKAVWRLQAALSACGISSLQYVTTARHV